MTTYEGMTFAEYNEMVSEHAAAIPEIERTDVLLDDRNHAVVTYTFVSGKKIINRSDRPFRL